MPKRYLIPGLLLLALLIVGVALALNKPATTSPHNNTAEDQERVIYGTDSESESEYRSDCEARGGSFDTCGSPCAPDADACIQVCAYTCEIPA